MARRIGIFSGTFDPIHEGHLAFAGEALKHCGLEKVFLLVEPRPRRKQGVKALAHRQKMVELAIADEPGLGQIVLAANRFTVAMTLPALQARFKGAELYFLMGDDMLAHFTDADWPHIDEFVKAVTLVIGIRKRSETSVRQHIALLEKTRSVNLKYELFVPAQAIQNATSVRRALREGEAPAGIRPAVLAYIREHGLYAPGDASE